MERIPQYRLPRWMLYQLPKGRQMQGRPLLGRLDDVEEDVHRVGIRRWRRHAANRHEWKRIKDKVNR